MKIYDDPDIEELISNASFISWVLVCETEDELFWNDFLAKHPNKRQLIDRARNIVLSLKVAQLPQPLSDHEVEQISMDIKERIVDTRKLPLPVSPINNWWFRAAAILLVVATIGVILWREHNVSGVEAVSNDQPQMISYINSGKKAQVLPLSDGSLVLLKAHSKLRYPATFGGKERKVELTGEAFFEVHKDAAHPFLVRSQNMTTKVLGTSFTVSAYTNEAAFKVIVNTGKVQVTGDDNNGTARATVIVMPDQQAVYTRSSHTLVKDTVRSSPVLSQGQAEQAFKFTNAPLSQIVARLESAYGIKINYDHQKYADATVTASLGKLPLDQKVSMVCKAIDAQYDLHDGEISIK